MTSIAPTLQSFFTDRLVRQRQASPRTVAAFRKPRWAAGQGPCRRGLLRHMAAQAQ